jgi:uncharacterized protein
VSDFRSKPGGAVLYKHQVSQQQGEIEMTQIIVEASPSAERLASLGVDHWQIWEKEVSRFPWEYFEDEISYILEGRAIITPEGGPPVEISKGNLVTIPSDMICIWNIVEPLRKRYHIG